MVGKKGFHVRLWRLYEGVRNRSRFIAFFGARFKELPQRLDDDYYDRLIIKKVEDFYAANGVRCFNLFDFFRGENPGELHVTKMDYHPNRYANEIASKAVADYRWRTSKLF